MNRVRVVLSLSALLVGCGSDGRLDQAQVLQAVERGSAMLQSSELGSILTGSADCGGPDVDRLLVEKAEPLVYIGNVPLFGTRDTPQQQKEVMAALMLMASGDAQLWIQQKAALEQEREAALSAPDIAAALEAVAPVAARCVTAQDEADRLEALAEEQHREDEAACKTNRGQSGWYAEDILCLAQRRLPSDQIEELAQSPRCRATFTAFKHRLKGLNGDCVFPAMNEYYASVSEGARTQLGQCQSVAAAEVAAERQAIERRAVSAIDGKLKRLEKEADDIGKAAVASYVVELRDARLIQRNDETRKVSCSAAVHGRLRDRPNATMKLGVVDYTIQRPNDRDVLLTMTRNYENAQAEQQELMQLFASAATFVQ